jgi:antitoxin component YwqK of YwqJK toxin-antitoxin module
MRILLRIILFALCMQNGFSQTWEINLSNNDTINYSLPNGERKGKWILHGRHKPHTCYAPNQVAETGNYEHNTRQGIWKEFNCDNTLKSEKNYIKGKVNGAVILYQENGKLFARGTFKIDHWVNGLELFDANGGLLYRINFDENGNRIQTTFFHYQKAKRDSTIIFKALP